MLHSIAKLLKKSTLFLKTPRKQLEMKIKSHKSNNGGIHEVLNVTT